MSESEKEGTVADPDPHQIRSNSSLHALRSLTAYWMVAALVALLAILYHQMPGSQGFPLDDGYISLHSAQVLHWGKDPNFPGVPALAGITNAPYTLLLWALLFVLAPLNALQAASWLGILCYALGLVALCRAFRLPWPAVLAVVALGATAGKVSYHLLNGVETGMALGITAWIFALTKWNTTWSRRAAAFLCGLAPFLRPELAALSTLVLSNMIWQEYFKEKSLARTARNCLPLLLLAMAAAAPWFLWYGVNTGVPIPQSIEAKRVFFAEGCAPNTFRWHVVSSAVSAFMGNIGFLVISLVFLVRNSLGKCALAFVGLFFFAYYERLPGALFHNWGRYSYLLLPIVLLGMLFGLRDRAQLIRVSAYSLLALSCLQTAVSFPDHWRHFLHDRDSYTQALSSVSEWSNHNLPPNSTLLIHDAGYISYATKFRMVDLVGLKTPSSIEFNRKYTYGTCGISRALAVGEIARSAKPDYLVVVEDWNHIFQITGSLAVLGWHMEQVFGSESYSVYRLTPPAVDHLAEIP
ncbi:MAG: hypothetical protein LAO30_09105 [Acidobacteriia bacterium]|nr:hypothetical protein [Terriglobia bacterium]